MVAGALGVWNVASLLALRVSRYEDAQVYIRRPSDIGLIVEAARKALSKSPDDIAKLLRVSRFWINEFEGGKPTVRLNLMLRAQAEFDITLTALTIRSGWLATQAPAYSF